MERTVHKAVTVQADAQHVHAKPGPSGDDVADQRQHHQTAIFHESTPAAMQDNGVPDHDHEGAVFIGIPAPESAPRVVAPKTA